MTDLPQKPTREEFLKFWQKHGKLWPAIRPYIIYLGTLAAYAALMPYLVDTTAPISLELVVAGYAALVVGMPWIWIWRGQRWARQHKHLLWCQQCGDEFYRDTGSNNYRWQIIAQTGKCIKCGNQVLAEPSEHHT
jgi:hypothetical protein